MNIKRKKIELELKELIVNLDKYSDEFPELKDKAEKLKSILMDERIEMRWLDEPGEPCSRCNGTGIEPS